MQVAAPPTLYVGLAHETQAPLDAAPEVTENVPAAQGVHVDIDVAPAAEDHVPLAHGVHVTLEDAPVADDHVPGGQTVGGAGDGEVVSELREVGVTNAESDAMLELVAGAKAEGQPILRTQ